MLCTTICKDRTGTAQVGGAFIAKWTSVLGPREFPMPKHTAVGIVLMLRSKYLHCFRWLDMCSSSENTHFLIGLNPLLKYQLWKEKQGNHASSTLLTSVLLVHFWFYSCHHVTAATCHVATSKISFRLLNQSVTKMLLDGPRKKLC